MEAIAYFRLRKRYVVVRNEVMCQLHTKEHHYFISFIRLPRCARNDRAQKPGLAQFLDRKIVPIPF